MSDYTTKDIRIFCWKYKIGYIGWIMVHKEQKSMLYCDSKPTITIEPELNMIFACFGFTKKGVMRKLTKKAMKVCKDLKDQEG